MDDLECIGLRCCSEFDMEQYVHVVDGIVALSPNVGKIQLMQKHVLFVLEIT